MLAFVLATTLAATPALPAFAAEKHEFNVPAAAASAAIREFAFQADIQILVAGDNVEGKRLNAVSGELSTEQGLNLLLADSGLKPEFVGDRSIAIVNEASELGGDGASDTGLRPRGSQGGNSAQDSSSNKSDGSSQPEASEKKGFWSRLRLAQSDNQSSTAANASDSESRGGLNLEEVTVTARKREERLQDVPASIAAASGETIAQLNIVSVTELDAIAPGLTFATNPSRFGSGPAIALRGISTQTQSAAVQDSVGIVIDGVPISRAKAGSFPEFSDTARVEVLRGPQGTLFGKNASAGVISVTSKDPTSVLESEASFGYGTYDDRQARAAIGGPLVDNTLLGRLSVYDKSRDGYVDNIFDGSEWEADRQKGARGKLVFTPTADDTFKLTGDFVDQKNDAGANVIRSFTPVTPQYVRDALGAIAGPENDRINARSFGRNHHKAGGAALQWDRTVGEHTLTAIGAYRTFDQDFRAGTYTWLTPLNEGIQIGFTDLQQYTAEVRVASPSRARLDYVAGVFFLGDEIDTGIQDPSTLNVQTGARFGRNYVSKVETLNYAPFAEANWHLTDQLTLTGGLRWTHEEVDVVITGNPIAAGLARVGHPLGVTVDSATDDNVSWRVGGQWNTNRDLMLYTTVATGFKGPAFNVNTSVLGNAQQADAETSISFEVGMKSQFFDRRMTLNVAAFRSHFKDFQAQGGLFLPGSPLSSIVLLNAGKLLTQGFEAELAATLGDSTYLGMNATFIDATFKEFKNAQCYPGQTAALGCTSGVQDLTGARLPNTPEWSVNLLGSQEFALPGTSWRGYITGDYSWRSSVQWHNLDSPYGVEPSYGLLGASLGVRSENDRVNFKLYGKNLTDKFHTSGIAVGEQVTHFLPPDYRRVIGIDATFRL